MVDTNKIIDDILSKLNLPFYDFMPEFGVNEEPETYIVYDCSDIGEQYADNELLSTEITVTVNIFITDNVAAIKKRLMSDFMANGWVYLGGGKLPTDDKSFPLMKRYYIEFKTSIDYEE